MKILVALSRFPYPIDKGDKLRAYYQIRDLSKDHEIYLVCLTEEEPSKESIQEIRNYCKELIIIRLNYFAKLFHLFCGIFNSLPFQVNYFRSSKMKKEIARVIVAEKIDVCYVQLIRLFKNIPFGLDTVYFLDYMDAFSSGMKKRKELSKWYEKPIVGIEARRLEQFEGKVIDYFQGFSIISRADADAITDSDMIDIHIIPNGVNEEYFNTPLKSYQQKEIDLIFTGNMGYYPNIQAAKVLVYEILPQLKKRGYPVRLCLAGYSPSSEVQAMRSEQVVVTGYVKDLRDYLSRAKIFVAPLFTGSGLQNKILEAMAAGLPVITSSQANNALRALASEITVRDTPSDYVQAIIDLLENEAKARDFGENGKNFIKNNYNWNKSNQKLEEALKECQIINSAGRN